MKIFKVGESIKAICSNCQSLETATFKLCDVPFSDHSGMVKNVMAGVCDKCGQISVIPNQSTPAIKKQLDAQRKPVEGRVPAHLIDILNLATVELGGSPDFVPTLMKFYIHKLAENKRAALSISAFLQNDLAHGKADKRISLKGKQISADIEVLKGISKIESTTDLLKSVILKINDDVLINNSQAEMQQLKQVMASVA